MALPLKVTKTKTKSKTKTKTRTKSKTKTKTRDQSIGDTFSEPHKSSCVQHHQRENIKEYYIGYF